jgi:hypothetical protein
MDDYSINDVRTEKDLKGITFSQFKKNKVINELLTSLINSKIEPACYWSGELICAGHYIDLWELIFLFVSKYIHLGNPKLPIYISIRINAFKDIIHMGYTGNELELRNNTKIRHLFSEIISSLCFSRKKHSFETVKLNSTDEFSMTTMQTKLKAPNISFAEIAFRTEDPKELYVAINEFSYHISKHSKNSYTACYWLEWLLEFEMTCRRHKHPCIAERRTTFPVEQKYQNDSIWIIWEIIQINISEMQSDIHSKIVDALLEMFCLRYTSSIKKKRKYILYYCISLLTEKYDIDIPIWNDRNHIRSIVDKIDIVYKEIKKNELVPATDYLFKDVKKSNLEKTRERLETMNMIMNG